MATRRTTRISRSENPPTLRTGASRSTLGKARPVTGLSKAAHDPNIAPDLGDGTVRTHKLKAADGNGTASASSAQPAATKRKRDALATVSTQQQLNHGKSSKLPVASDKENVGLKRPASTAYVEITSQSQRLRMQPSNVRTKTSGAATSTSTRSRIVVKRDDDVQLNAEQPAPGSDAMAVDEPVDTLHGGASLPSSRSTLAKSAMKSNRPLSSKTRLRARDAESSRAVDYFSGEEPASKKRRTSSVEPESAAPPLSDAINMPDITEEDFAEAEANLVVEDAKLTSEHARWDDLDKLDEGDPTMVSEYVVEIFTYIRHLETLTMPNPHYVDGQKELAWKMRGILMDWLIQVHARFRLLPETLFLAVNIIDRFLSARTVSLTRLQLVGITAMFIAAKYEEVLAPSVQNFVYCSDSEYVARDILDAEKYILRSLDYNLSYPNPIVFLRRASKADGYDIQVRTVAKYFVEIGCLEWRLLPFAPSAIAAAGIWFARLVLNREEWNANMEHYSGYSEDSLLPAAQVMLTYILRAVKHESFFKKYAAKKYLKVSVFVREWAWSKFGSDRLEYDEEGEALNGTDTNKNVVRVPTEIRLASELARLKDEARSAREEAERERGPEEEGEFDE